MRQNESNLIQHDALAWFFVNVWIVASVSVLRMGPMHYSRDPQTYFFRKIFIKNGSHDTIYTFKNYFVTVFSIFSNKRYPNRP